MGLKFSISRGGQDISVCTHYGTQEDQRATLTASLKHLCMHLRRVKDQNIKVKGQNTSLHGEDIATPSRTRLNEYSMECSKRPGDGMSKEGGWTS